MVEHGIVRYWIENSTIARLVLQKLSTELTEVLKPQFKYGITSFI